MVVPTVESIILTPISAHMLAMRPLVVPADAEVTVATLENPEELIVTVDGQVGTELALGEKLIVRTRTESCADRSISRDDLLRADASEAWMGRPARSRRAAVMLTELRIRNFAIIESLTLPLGQDSTFSRVRPAQASPSSSARSGFSSASGRMRI